MILRPTISCLIACISILVVSCSKSASNAPPVTPPVTTTPLQISSTQINGTAATDGAALYNLNITPAIQYRFSAPVNKTTVTGGVEIREASGAVVPIVITYANGDSTVIVQPATPLKYITRYSTSISGQVASTQGAVLQNLFSATLITAIDSTDKFTRISDAALLDLVQRQTFKYFWDFGHPVSGLARERNTSGDVVTSGGSGFGIMSIVTAVNRGFITRAEGRDRLIKIVDFLKNKAQRFHGAYPHWINGATGAVVPFSTKDNGADLVETSFLMQGLLTARQFFSGTAASEITLRNDINELWNGVEWDWFRQSGQNVLYWHWSPNFSWDMNVKLQGWNEALVTYVLAASSTTHSIPKVVYDNGWANNGAMKNGNNYYGVPLPLGPALGGPLFFEHYSFLGIDPFDLNDAYANYETQAKNHTLINYNYSVANPLGYYGYSSQSWGLTASDIPNGYTASSPSNDVGVIAPTAALSSMPYTPDKSMDALKFFYYKLGDKIFKEYGFVDAFKLNDPWFASSFLAIDQGPIIIMIENHRSKLLWNLFMSCPEVKDGMKKLGFTSPRL